MGKSKFYLEKLTSVQYFIASFIYTGLGPRSSITNAFMLLCVFFKPGVDSKLCAC